MAKHLILLFDELLRGLVDYTVDLEMFVIDFPSKLLIVQFILQFYQPNGIRLILPHFVGLILEGLPFHPLEVLQYLGGWAVFLNVFAEILPDAELLTLVAS